MKPVNEELLQETIARKAELYYEKYRPQMDILEQSEALRLAKKSPTLFDYYSLGEQLAKWESYMRFAEESGSVSALGPLPRVALDVISVSYASSILPVLASVQPLEEELGTVYYKRLKAGISRGGVSAGDTLTDARTGMAANAQYVSEKVSSEHVGDTAAATTSYSFTLAYPPVRKNTVKVTVPDLNFEGQDNGNGLILGYGFSGTINYETGAISLTFASDPGGTHAIYVTYSTDFEKATNIPEASMELVADGMEAEILVISENFGVFQAFAFNKRFGKVAEDEIASDLAGELMARSGLRLVQEIDASYTGTPVTFSMTPPSGVAEAEHRKALLFKILNAEARIVAASGRGVTTHLVCGANATAYVASLPTFKQNVLGNTVGPVIYGTLNDNIVVVRAPNMPSNRIYVIYSPVGTSAFEAAAVVGVYMPLFVSDTIRGISQNPLQNTRFAGSWAGFKVTNKEFIAAVDLV